VSTTVTPTHELPAGTVTLLFADVEGSTRLLNLLGERFGPARARMRDLVREAAREHGGLEVDWAGDGVFLAFPSAREAVAAAARIHRSLADEPWPDEEAHRLRIGVHTGEPELGAEGYVGIDVVIASRICASAHGEQVVVSQATRDVSGAEPLPGASYRPLGRHRLKDVPAAVQLFQLVAPGLREDFPPLKTLTATSLPALHHRLVGREDVLARVEETLDAGARLVTITGPGGAGKSRLALEVAARAALDRPVHLVGLAPVSDAELMPGAVARALGVRESGAQPVVHALADRLEGSGALLYLDNLEHLPGAAAHVAALLDRAPDLQVLVTSRTALRLTTERIVPLGPLSIDDAATLFVELAAARGVVLQAEALESVHEICRRLDGLPLAIELVAARLVVLPPAEIVRALEEGLALDMEGPVDLPERQRTLRAAIDWSYGRLSESQRLLHGTLAVFTGGASLDDARALAPSPSTFLSDLEGLVGWSLVRSEAGDGAVRLSMLETVREHALRHLDEAGTLERLRSLHADRFLALALAAEPGLAGANQAGWLDRLELEYDNLVAAIEWLLASQLTEDALRILSALERFWRGHAHVTEARRWLAQALEQSAGVAAAVRASALRTAALQAAAQSDWGAARSLLTSAREIHRDDGNLRDEVLGLGYLSFFAQRQGDDEAAERFALEAVSISADLEDDRARAAALTALADVHTAQGRHDEAVAGYSEAVELRTRFGDPLLVTDAVYNLGKAAFQAGDLDRARAALVESLARARELGEMAYAAAALLLLSHLELAGDDPVAAGEHARESLELYTQLEDDRSRARCLVVLARAAASRGSLELAARLLGAAEAAREDDPPDEYEAPILATLAPEIEEQLGRTHVADLLAEGRAGRPIVRIDAEA
jgi:predicted ATPase/class 3 adenylate cyclase